MTRILFVDDEQSVLDGLRRALYSMRSEWKAEFACGAAAALKTLESQSFDVIVTDMRMPGIDGGGLLQLVMEKYPELLRIVLSGQSETTALIRSAGVAHQYLAKPCSTDELKSTINRSVSLRRLLHDPALRAVLSQIDTLPSVPPLYLELVKLLNSPYTSLDQIGRVIAKDMAMCAKVLQLANSAFFGRRQAISNPAEAAGILGFNMLKSLSLALRIFKVGESGKVAGFHLDALWQHSLKVSYLAEQIAKQIAPLEPEVRDQAQVAGLLHDVGRLVMASRLAAGYQATIDLNTSKEIELIDAEREVFGVSHAEVGAYILALWGLPQAVVEAVAFHHSAELLQQDTSRGKRPIAAVYAADVIAHAAFPEAEESCVRLLTSLFSKVSPGVWLPLIQAAADAQAPSPDEVPNTPVHA